jgi:hypothetical protein
MPIPRDSYPPTSVLRYSTMFGLPSPASLPCPECGAAMSFDGGDHVCDEERRRWHQLFLVNGEIEELEDEVRDYLTSPQGQFEAFYAERQRLATAA